jgi:hypothetical protein
MAVAPRIQKMWERVSHQLCFSHWINHRWRGYTPKKPEVNIYLFAKKQQFFPTELSKIYALSQLFSPQQHPAGNRPSPTHRPPRFFCRTP